MIKVKDEPHLVRDSNNVIQNTNNSAYIDYINSRKKINDDRDRISTLEKDNAEIKDSLTMILKLLMEK